MVEEPLMDGRVIVITGAARGIGREIALLAAKYGAQVVVNDVGASGDGSGVDPAPADEVVAEIEAIGGRAVADVHDVASWSGAAAIIERAVATFGHLDAVVNNAGILRDAIFHRMTEADWDAVVAVNLKGAFNVSRAAMPHFRKQEAGAFVHMTSASGLIGNFGQVNYAAAKAGIMGLSKGIALDGARFGVRSNCIMPFAWSRLVGTIPANDSAEAARIERMKQMSPAHIAPMAVYLASPASAAVTGQVFAVRKNEIFLLSQPRPLRSIHRSEGWTPETVSAHAIPALSNHFYPLDRSSDVFGWDPV